MSHSAQKLIIAKLAKSFGTRRPTESLGDFRYVYAPTVISPVVPNTSHNRS
jgi:hypothetical protein